jgi:hypothetical protein
LTNYSPNNPSLPYYKDGIPPILFNDLWSDSYKVIYMANAVVAGLGNNSKINVKIKNQLIGEAYFTRAFLNFNLINLFGDIPLVTNTNYSSNAILPRTAVSAVYLQIINDCKNADNLLGDNFIDNSDTTVTTERTRPNKWAAEALLARVYLYTNDYIDAETMATNVIGNSALFSLTTSLSDVFLANSTESIWQLQNNPSFTYVAEGNNFTISYGLSTYGESSSSTISPQLLSAFEPGDNRKTTWIGTYKDYSGNTYLFPNKYQKINYGKPITQYSSVLRLAEQFLIRAESRVQQGNTSGALADLNVIRNRAGLANYSGLTDKSSLITAILHERQVEFFTEYGQRWFDLKRTNQANTVMGIVTPLKGGVWSSYKQLWPIPQGDLSTDPKLTQNTGY